MLTVCVDNLNYLNILSGRKDLILLNFPISLHKIHKKMTYYKIYSCDTLYYRLFVFKISYPCSYVDAICYKSDSRSL